MCTSKRTFGAPRWGSVPIPLPRPFVKKATFRARGRRGTRILVLVALDRLSLVKCSMGQLGLCFTPRSPSKCHINPGSCQSTWSVRTTSTLGAKITAMWSGSLSKQPLAGNSAQRCFARAESGGPDLRGYRDGLIWGCTGDAVSPSPDVLNRRSLPPKATHSITDPGAPGAAT